MTHSKRRRGAVAIARTRNDFLALKALGAAMGVALLGLAGLQLLAGLI